MYRTRMSIVAFVALALSTGVTFLVYRLLQDRIGSREEMTAVVIAVDKLPLGARISDQHLRTVMWPSSAQLTGSFSNPIDVIGRGVIVPIAPNEPILESKLAPREAGAGMTTAIPEGMRAVAVKVNDVVGVAGFVLPGTRVDVILSGSVDRAYDANTARVILENVQVLAAGKNTEQDRDGKPEDVQVVTLLVTPEDSQKLALGSIDGRIQLALRNPLDLTLAKPSPVTKSVLYGGPAIETRREAAVQIRPIRHVSTVASAPVPAPPPPPPVPVAAPPVDKVAVEMIQGTTHKMLEFEVNQ